MSYVPLAGESLGGSGVGTPLAGFYTRAARAYGVTAALVGLIVLLLGVGALIALLDNAGVVDVLLGVVVAVVTGAAAVLLLRWSARLWNMRLMAGPGGVTILGPRRDHHLGWEQIRVVRPVTVGSLRPWATNVVVVVVDLASGGSVVVHSLRFDGGWARSAPSERVGQAKAMCYAIERVRPQPHGTPRLRKRPRPARKRPPRSSVRAN